MKNIIPIRDLKNTTAISELCHSTNEPVFVTKNGYGDMVIMSMETYETMNRKVGKYELPVENSYKSGMAAESQIKYGDAEKGYNAKPYTINEIRKVLSPIFAEYNVNSAVLFGSYAKGCANERSDIDIIVDSGLKGLKFFGLLEDVASSLRVPVDLIERREIKAGSNMEKEISDTGVLIYG